MTDRLVRPTHRLWLAQHTLDLLAFGQHTPHPDGGARWLDNEGMPRADTPTYTWITGRMTHVDSIGSLLGVPGAAPVAERTLADLVERPAVVVAWFDDRLFKGGGVGSWFGDGRAGQDDQAQARGEPVETAVAGGGDVGCGRCAAPGVDGGLDEVLEHPQGVRCVRGEDAWWADGGGVVEGGLEIGLTGWLPASVMTAPP